jgi:hypothetical protein
VARHLSLSLLLAGALVAAGCGGSTQQADEEQVEPKAAPLPISGIASQKVALYPITMVIAERRLDWGELMGTREEALHMADSMIAEFFTERVPEVDWVMPDELRRMARQAPGLLPDPDKMGTAMLREEYIVEIPDPLRSQLRNLTGVVGDRYAVIPSALGFFATEEEGIARAELYVVVVDVRKGFIEWRTKATGEGDDPRDALWEALLELVPGMP